MVSISNFPRARVLVIDDEYGARLQVELALMTSTTVEIVGNAENGSEGAELAASMQPHVVLLDLTMPVMDGFEALPLIRAVAPKAKLLVRSSHDEPTFITRAMQLGADAYIPKFIDPDELREVVEHAAAGAASPLLVEVVERARMRRWHPSMVPLPTI